MRAKSTTAQQTPADTDSGPPEVIVDFVFDRGLFHLVVENIGATPAYRVSVKFNREFRGMGGTQEMSGLRLFRCIEFLAPHKRIEMFLDTSSAYFQRREPTRLTASILFRDARRRSYERRIVHDLSIYRDLSYLVGPTTANTPVASAAGASTTTRSNGGMNYGRIERPSLQ